MKAKETKATALAEWRGYWSLPSVAALGCAVNTLLMYSIGPFFQPIQAEFHWTRAEVASGLTISVAAGALLNPAIGWLIDKFGPRRVGLAGVAGLCGAIALVGSATGSLTNWLALWLLVMLFSMLAQPMVWAAAVASRFDAGRGLAIALTSSGGALGMAVHPLLGTWLIEHYGWRLAFVGLGCFWAAIALPLLFLFFRGAADGIHSMRAKGAAADMLPGLETREGLRAAAFHKLLLVGLLFTFCLVGITVHLVPIMVNNGLTPIMAAAVAGLLGIFSIVGRVVTGILLDRWPANRVAAACCFLPIAGAGCMLVRGDWLAQAVGVAAIGLSLASESQLITYIATKHLGLKRFGTLFGIIMVPMALGTAVGPLAAAMAFDRFASYDAFLWLTMPLMAVAALTLTLFGREPDFGAGETAPSPAGSGQSERQIATAP